MSRPSAKDLIDAIVQAMHAGYEPLDADLILVPSVFDVMLHPNVYQELRTLLPRIRAQAEKRLDEELARLNTRQPRPVADLLARVFGKLRRLLFADRPVPSRYGRPASYERAGDAWRVDFLVTAEPEAGIDYLVVETDFGMPAAQGLQGSPTISVRRRTMRLPDGRFETVITARRPGATRQDTKPVPSTDILARLIYEDNQGRHVYYMRKPQIVIGRRDDPAQPLDIALDTLADVSREHARIRHDPDRGTFALQNVSRFGVTIDGRPVASCGASGVEEPAWHPLPSRAEIGLANVVFIQFEAL